MANKVIKVLFEADPTSFARVKQQLESLAGVAKRAMEAGGGVLTGSVGSSNNRNGQVTVRGSGSGSSPQMQKVGISQAVSQNIASQAAMFKGLAQDATKALADMNTAVANSVRHQTTNLNKLIGVVKELGGAFGALPAGMGGYASGGGGGGSGSGGGGSGRGGGGGSAASPGNGQLGEADYGNGTKKEGFSRRETVLAGALAATVIASAPIMRDAPYQFESDRAKFGGPIQQTAMNIARANAEGAKWLHANIEANGPRSDYKGRMNAQTAELDNYDKTSTLGYTWNTLKGAVGSLTSGEKGGAGNKLGTIGSKLAGIAQLGSGTFANIPGTMMSLTTTEHEMRAQEMQSVQDEITANPFKYMGEDALFNNVEARSRIGAKLNIGGLYTRKGKGGTGTSVGHRLLEYTTRLSRGAFTPEDAAAGQDSIVTLGGFHAANSYKELAMRGQRGHFNDIGSIIGAVAQAGQDPGEFAAQLVGRGGKHDQQAWNNIGMMVGKEVAGGGTEIDAQAALRTAAGAMSAGPGTQMWNADALAQGRQLAGGQMFGGGMDNLQKARNYVNALSAFGGNTAAAQLISNNPNAMSMVEQANAGGAVDPRLLALGYTKDTAKTALKQYGAGVYGDNFRNYEAFRQGKFDPDRVDADKMFMEYKSSGSMDFGQLAKGKNWKGAELAKNVNTAAAILSVGQVKSDGSPYTLKEAQGLVMSQYATANPEDAKNLESGSFQNVLGKQEKKILGTRADTQAKADEQAAKISLDLIGKMGPASERLSTMGKDLDGAAKRFQQSLEDLATATDNITIRLGGKITVRRGTMVTVPPGTAPPRDF